MGNESNRMYQIWKYDFVTKETVKIFQNDNDLISVGLSMSNDEKIFFHICIKL